ncbi:MAG: hypothetical protein KDD64_00605 [Bdellovibrionales bacterium]|nr:hypothetical protein [Bdellovibrionales bacterium]
MDEVFADKIDSIAVAIILSTIAYSSGGHAQDWSAALAVFIGFRYTQCTARLASLEPLKSSESNALLVSKEFVWALTFYLLGSYPLVFGAGTFLTYPFWRRRLFGLVRPIFFGQNQDATPKVLSHRV